RVLWKGRAPSGEGKAVRERLDDVQVEPPHPHARDRAFLGRRPDQRGLGVRFFAVFADRRDLGEEAAVVELEARELAGGILREVRLAAILAAQQVDLDERELDALLGEKDPYDAG